MERQSTVLHIERHLSAPSECCERIVCLSSHLHSAQWEWR